MKSTKDLSFEEKVELHYQGKANLLPRDKELLHKVETAFAFLMDHRSKTMAAAQLVEVYKQKGISMTMRTAYMHLSMAEKIFTPIESIGKETHRLMTIRSASRDIDMVQKWIDDTLQASKAKKKVLLDIKTFKTLMDIKNKAELRIIKAAGLEDYTDVPDFSALEPSTYAINLPEPILKALQSIMSNGGGDVTLLYEKLMGPITDAEIIDE